jgi:hypothetical protein
MFNRLRFRFRGLFGVVLFVGVAAPLLSRGPVGAYFLQLLLTVVFLGALNAVSEGKGPLRRGLILAIPAIAVTWIARFVPGNEGLASIGVALGAVFLTYAILHIFGFVFRARRVTSEVLFAALALYLLIGLVFALTFTVVEAWQPGSLSLPTLASGPPLSDASQFSTISYFSYVTLTTLGYGDIGPLTPTARSLVTLEALLGQLFIAVLIARLVALHIMHESEGDPKQGGE